jgi:hypothetical protein
VLIHCDLIPDFFRRTKVMVRVRLHGTLATIAARRQITTVTNRRPWQLHRCAACARCAEARWRAQLRSVQLGH